MDYTVTKASTDGKGIMNPDYEIWHASHDTCGEDGCGGCSVVDLEWSDEEWADIESAAKLAGEPIDVFIHKAIVIGMRAYNAGD